MYTAVRLVVTHMTPCPTSIIVIGVFFVSALTACFRLCKSLIMNLCLGYHLLLCGILSNDFELCVEDFFSTKTLGTVFVTSLAASHMLILKWVGYRIAICVSHQINDIGRALAMIKRTVLHLYRRHDYEELRDSLTHN